MRRNRGATRTRELAKGFAAAMLPLTIVALAAGPREASAEAPPWLPLGDLATGSSGPGSGANPAGTSAGSASSLGPGAVPSGSAFGSDAEGPPSGGPLGLGPIRTPSGSAGSGSARPGYLATGSADPDSAGLGLAGTGNGTHATADAAPRPTGMAGSPAEALQLDTGSVQMACSGSALAGSALLMLGSATGSGFGSFGSSLIGPGSNGSALGSAAVGSAATGSALLTCLLLIPAAPPVPMSPLNSARPPRIHSVPSHRHHADTAVPGGATSRRGAPAKPPAAKGPESGRTDRRPDRLEPHEADDDFGGHRPHHRPRPYVPQPQANPLKPS